MQSPATVLARGHATEELTAAERRRLAHNLAIPEDRPGELVRCKQHRQNGNHIPLELLEKVGEFPTEQGAFRHIFVPRNARTGSIALLQVKVIQRIGSSTARITDFSVHAFTASGLTF
jgi:hypothetical protein